MLSCVAPNVINAAMVEVFPTTVRGMAVCLISGVLSAYICNVLNKRKSSRIFNFMYSKTATSRLGAVFGAIISAYLLDKHCESAFYLSGISLIGRW